MIMRIRALSISASVLALAFAGPALAQECNTAVYGKVATGYVLADMGVVGTEEPVAQGGITHTCGRFYGDLWTSVELADGEYGNRGTGDEIDLTFGFRDSYDSPIGSVNVDVSVAYFALGINSLGTMSDDVVALQADVSRPISMGMVTVTLGVHVTHVIGIDAIEDLTIARPYAQVGYRIDERWSLAADIGYAYDLTNETNVTRYGAGVTYQATDRLSFTLRGDDTNRTGPVYSIGFAAAF